MNFAAPLFSQEKERPRVNCELLKASWHNEEKVKQQ